MSNFKQPSASSVRKPTFCMSRCIALACSSAHAGPPWSRSLEFKDTSKRQNLAALAAGQLNLKALDSITKYEVELVLTNQTQDLTLVPFSPDNKGPALNFDDDSKLTKDPMTVSPKQERQPAGHFENGSFISYIEVVVYYEIQGLAEHWVLVLGVHMPIVGKNKVRVTAVKDGRKLGADRTGLYGAYRVAEVLLKDDEFLDNFQFKAKKLDGREVFLQLESSIWQGTAVDADFVLKELGEVPIQ